MFFVMRRGKRPHVDTRTLERKFNQIKAKVEERRGPAGYAQRDVPILDGIRNFHAEDTLSLAIPAHKSGAGAPAYAKEVLGAQVFWADQTMLNGVDNRHESWEVQTAAQNLAAEALGADQCLFSTNGSTTSVHTAMSAVVGPGEKLALSRNAHKSVITGLIHTGAVPVWLEPEYDEDLDLSLETYETTSGSSVLLASIDAARRQMVEDGEALLGEALRLAHRLRAGARELGLETIEPDDILQRPSAWAFNELHVTIDFAGLGITGFKAADWLRGECGVAVELSDHRRVMAAVSHADTDESINRTLAADKRSHHAATVAPSHRAVRPRPQCQRA